MEGIRKKFRGFLIDAFWMQDGFCAYLIYSKKKLLFYEFNYYDGELKNAGQAYKKAKEYIKAHATPS